MKIGIDVDNVLNNLIYVLLDHYNKAANDVLTIDDITDYKIDSFVKPKWRDRIWEFFADKNLWHDISCIPDSQYYIHRLIGDGHKIYIVTATHGADFFGKWRWIKRHFPEVKTDNIIRCVHKQLLNLDVMVDDYQENLKGGNYEKILLDYPWNVRYKYAYHAKNWQEIYEHINRIGGIR